MSDIIKARILQRVVSSVSDLESGALALSNNCLGLAKDDDILVVRDDAGFTHYFYGSSREINTASSVSFTPYGSISATNVQTALQQIDFSKLNSSIVSSFAMTFLNDNTGDEVLTTIGGIPLSQKGSASGVATLGSDSKIPLIQIPTSSLVTSAFGRSGTVVATTGDYLFSQISGTASFTQITTIPANTILGNNTGGNNTIVPMTVAQFKTLLALTAADIPLLFAANMPAFTGDITKPSGSVATTLASVGTAGTYKSITTDAKGRVTAGTNPTTLAGYGITDAAPLASPTFTGNVAIPGFKNNSNTLSGYGCLWGSGLTPAVTNFCFASKVDGTDVYVNTNTTGTLAVGNSVFPLVWNATTLTANVPLLVKSIRNTLAEVSGTYSTGGNYVSPLPGTTYIWSLDTAGATVTLTTTNMAVGDECYISIRVGNGAVGLYWTDPFNISDSYLWCATAMTSYFVVRRSGSGFAVTVG